MEWDKSLYGDRIAEVYDELYEGAFDTAGAVAFLSQKANGGRALELAIGTGRLAIPLKNGGVDISGIDISDQMVAKLRAKPDGAGIPVTMGDFADVGVAGKFKLIFVAFNTLFAVTEQDDQFRCFRNVASHLENDGVFVVEAFVPDMHRFRMNQNTQVVELTPDRVMLDVSQHDPVLQRITSQHVFLTEEGVRLFPVSLRYMWPSEMDMTAKAAGMELRERYGSWNRDHFTSSSGSHISVYGRA